MEECFFLVEEIKLIDFDQIEFGPGLTQSSSLGEGKVFGGVIEL